MMAGWIKRNLREKEDCLLKYRHTQVNGTLINYYFHCKRQCYLHGNRLNLEDNSELVQIGKAIHKVKADDSENAELAIENVRLDKLTAEYLTEIKKSDADIEASKWQLYYYLKVLKNKGIIRKGKLEFEEKNKTKRATMILELGDAEEKELEQIQAQIEELLQSDIVPEAEERTGCKKCAYYEYCFI